MKDTRDMTGAELVAELTEQIRARDVQISVLTRQLADDREIIEGLDAQIETLLIDEAMRP